MEPDLPDPCDVNWTRDNGKSCIYSVPEGTDVTLQRLGSGNLVRWSVYECAGTGPCTVKMDASRTVVATFTPTRLALVVEGGNSGTVRSPEANLSCSGNGNCATSVPAFAEVTFNATPVAEFEKWSGACQEAGTAPTCTLVLSGDDVVGAKFKDDPDEPDIIPPRQQAELRVVVEGGGKVVSSRSRLSEAIDCSPNCKARFEQGERPTLTAQGERFLEWRGGAPYCTTNPTCRYPAFGITSIRGCLGCSAGTAPGAAAAAPRPDHDDHDDQPAADRAAASRRRLHGQAVERRTPPPGAGTQPSAASLDRLPCKRDDEAAARQERSRDALVQPPPGSFVAARRPAARPEARLVRDCRQVRSGRREGGRHPPPLALHALGAGWAAVPARELIERERSTDS